MKYMNQVQITEPNHGKGDVFVELPSNLLKKLKWTNGDNLVFKYKKNGSLEIRKSGRYFNPPAHEQTK